MRAALIAIGVIIVAALAGFIFLLITAETMQPEQGEVRIELEDTFPE